MNDLTPNFWLQPTALTADAVKIASAGLARSGAG